MGSLTFILQTQKLCLTHVHRGSRRVRPRVLPSYHPLEGGLNLGFRIRIYQDSEQRGDTRRQALLTLHGRALGLANRTVSASAHSRTMGDTFPFLTKNNTK